jgi:hypothetical protein
MTWRAMVSSGRPVAAARRGDAVAPEILAEQDQRVQAGDLLRLYNRAGRQLRQLDRGIIDQRRQVEIRIGRAAIRPQEAARERDAEAHAPVPRSRATPSAMRECSATMSEHRPTVS